MKLFLIIASLAIMSGCTMAKAVYFHVDEGNVSGNGIQAMGKGVTYHSVPCDLADCSQHSSKGESTH